MSFQGLQAKYRRLHQESRAWRMLRADNAPIIIAFIQSIFSEDSEVSFSRARVSLDAELMQCKDMGLDVQTNAAIYLNQWIRSGWLREMDDSIIKTEAADVAIRFSQGLDQPSASTTASHLRIVQQAVQDFAVAISPNADDRVALLEHKKAAIQAEIDALNAGEVVQLSETEQGERLREIYQLASVLTGDFRRVEDDIRQLDQQLRIEMIELDDRGDVLRTLMEKEELLAKTDSGSAFESFFNLLCDQNRTTELRDQLRSILNQPVAQKLKPQQQQFLSQLMRELSRESDRVFQIRRRTEESLRAYIESGEASENKMVDRLLVKLERAAVDLRDQNIDPKMMTQLSLNNGAIKINAPESMRLKMPDEQLDTTGVEENTNSTLASNDVLHCLDAVQVKQVAIKTHKALQKMGPMSIGSVIKNISQESSLEELVAYVRVAKAIKAPSLAKKERVEIIDKQGVCIQASIPSYVLSAELFPEKLDELVI